MKLTKTLALVAMFALAFSTGCGKKDKDKKSEPAKTVEPIKPTTPVEPPAAPSADADMEKGLVITEQLADVMDANKDDCAKMAAGISAFADQNMDAIKKGAEMAGTMKPEDAVKFSEKYKDRIAAYTAKMAGAGKCMADPAVMEAMKKMAPAPADEPKDDEPADEPADETP